MAAVAPVVSLAAVAAGAWASGAAALEPSLRVTSLRDFGVSRDPSLDDLGGERLPGSLAERHDAHQHRAARAGQRDASHSLRRCLVERAPRSAIAETLERAKITATHPRSWNSWSQRVPSHPTLA